MRISILAFVVLGISACRSVTPATPTGGRDVSPAIAPAGVPSPISEPLRCPLSSPARSMLALESGSAAWELRGRVVRVGSGAPLPDALVALEPGRHRTRADSAGYFRLPDLPAGSYEIQVQAMGLLTARDSVTVGGDGLHVVAALAAWAGDLMCVTVGPR